MRNLLLLLLPALLVVGCGEEKNPLDELASQNDHYPEYSIILEDMDDSPEKRHKYKIITGKPKNPKNLKDLTFETKTTGWMKVPSKVYDKYISDLGMVLYSKKDGKVSGVPQPPGYDKVGNSQYGQWKTDSSGNSFWAFYGQYMFFSHLMGGGLGSPMYVYRNDYDSYRSYRRSGRPYYGRSTNGTSRYGTGGTVTSQSNSKFNQRWKNKSAAEKSKFQSRVNAKKSSKRNFQTRVKSKVNKSSTSSRTGRSGMSGVRSRSGRSGK